MMKEEFENIVGYEVSTDDYYGIIEPMYYATNLSKEEFAKTISKKRFALPTRKELQKGMKEIAEHLKETFLHFTDYEAKEALQKASEAYIERFYGKAFADYYIHETEKFSCYYPVSIEIYTKKSGRTIEVINL